MRLLLDEHFPTAIAVQLRQRGHDVVAFGDRPELRGLDDTRILNHALAEGRALVTEDTDFVTVARTAFASGDRHAGIVQVSGCLRRSRRPVGLLIAALDALLKAEPADDALADRVHWLTQAILPDPPR